MEPSSEFTEVYLVYRPIVIGNSVYTVYILYYSIKIYEVY